MISARTSLKYFCEDAPDYHIVVAGSLLGVAVSRTKFSFPVGKVDLKTLYPMDLEEFMLALGEDALAEQIKKCFETDTPMPSAQLSKKNTRFQYKLIKKGGVLRNLKTPLNGCAFPASYRRYIRWAG
ncbi:MAG: hypothetical protein NC416_11010 [Eubacterium sp.]|nr:hypothetical protein [Eubacterium sp.]